MKNCAAPAPTAPIPSSQQSLIASATSSMVGYHLFVAFLKTPARFNF